MPHISFPKWGRDLNLDDNFNWKMILSLPFNVEQDTNLKWFQLRIIHKILGTNYLLNKMRLKQNDKCTFCYIDKKTIKHLFWKCERVQYFWDMLKTFLRDNCGFENISYNAVDTILGNPKFEGTLNKIVLWGKELFIDQKWKNNYLLSSWKLLRIKVTSDLHLAYSKKRGKPGVGFENEKCSMSLNVIDKTCKICSFIQYCSI